MTQVQLAWRVGVRPETVCRWETGARCPHMRDFAALAQVFNCSIADLIAD